MTPFESSKSERFFLNYFRMSHSYARLTLGHENTSNWSVCYPITHIHTLARCLSFYSLTTLQWNKRATPKRFAHDILLVRRWLKLVLLFGNHVLNFIRNAPRKTFLKKAGKVAIVIDIVSSRTQLVDATKKIARPHERQNLEPLL